MIQIPSHLGVGYALELSRSAPRGLSGYKTAPAPNPPYWTGQGYTSLSLGTQHRAEGSAEQRGTILLNLDPAPAGGELPKATDRLTLDGVEMTVLSVRPPNSLIGYWKLEVRTGAA